MFVPSVTWKLLVSEGVQVYHTQTLLSHYNAKNEISSINILDDGPEHYSAGVVNVWM